jgi:hypothetical protein
MDPGTVAIFVEVIRNYICANGGVCPASVRARVWCTPVVTRCTCVSQLAQGLWYVCRCCGVRVPTRGNGGAAHLHHTGMLMLVECGPGLTLHA